MISNEEQEIVAQTGILPSLEIPQVIQNPSNNPSKILDESNLGRHTNNQENIRKEKYFYDEEMDKGPFRVQIETKLNKIINKLTIGSLLKKFKKNSGVIDIKKNGRNRATVYFNRVVEANALLKSNELDEGYEVYLPAHFISVKGVVDGVPLDVEMEEIKTEIDCNHDILNAYRMNRFFNGKKEPTEKVAIIFRTRQLPKYVRIYNLRSKVEPFITKSTFCQNCCRYNHMTKYCKSNKKRCTKCSKVDCNEEACNNETYCFYCKANHRPNSKFCKEKEKQQQIRKIMANKAITFQEVRDELKFFLSNKFEVLDEIEEPNVFESFTLNYKSKTKTWKTNTRKTSISTQTEPEKIEDKKQSLKRKREEELGVIQDNPHKVSKETKEQTESIDNKEVEVKYQNILYKIYNKLINKQDMNQLLVQLESNLKYELIKPIIL